MTQTATGKRLSGKMALFLVLGAVLLTPQAAQAGRTSWYTADEVRTNNRTVLGRTIYPDWILALPEHYAFTPRVSNTDPQHQHPAQWEGSDWQPEKWHPDWTPEIVLEKLYAARVFANQYFYKDMPVLELGPAFFKLSDLDRRRTLKLLADQTDVFARGYGVITLKDWYTKDVVGQYTPQGMYLN